MLGKDQKIEDLIINTLSNGPLETKELIVDIKEKRPQTTKQAVYKSLRNLKKNEIIVKTKDEVALSSVWLKKLLAFIENTARHYKTNKNPGSDFLSLKNGEKIVYWFKNFEATDLFWAHAFDVLTDTTNNNQPIFIYNPHEWFLLARPESEVFLFESLRKNNRKLFLIAGNQDMLDIEAKKYFDNTITNYYASAEKLFDQDNYYVNIFNDYLIEVWLDPKISNLIDKFYKKTTSFNEAAKNELLKIIRTKGRNKLVIYRNERKAKKIKNIFKKVFIY